MGTRLSFNKIKRVPEADKVYPFPDNKFDDILDELIWLRVFSHDKEVRPEIFQFSGTSNIVYCLLDWIVDKKLCSSIKDVGIPFSMWFSENDLIEFTDFSRTWSGWGRDEKQFVLNTLFSVRAKINYSTHHLVVQYA